MKHPLTRYVLDIEQGIRQALQITDKQLLDSMMELNKMPATLLRTYVIQEIDRKLKS